MTTKDVLALALEALEAAEFVYTVGLLSPPEAVKAVKAKRDVAITAIKQAQAAPKQAQEPVARVVVKHEGRLTSVDFEWAESVNRLGEGVYPVYLHLAPKQAEPSWQSIESAPKDGSEILLANPDGSCAVGWFKFRGHTTGWTDGDTFNMTWPTHWMPMPTPPEEK